jgi:hypothetical protein
MRKVLCVLSVLFMLSWASAQTDNSTGQSSSTDQSMHKGMNMHKGGAGALTGCLSGSGPEGLYVLQHGAKKIDVGGNDDLSKHVGHTVRLHGSWATASDVGKMEKTEKGAKPNRYFKVASIDHIADSCQTSAAMGGHKHKMGTEKTGAAPQASPSPSPQ